MPYWSDPSNQDTSILRNQIRKKYPIQNYSGLRKTAFNMMQEIKQWENMAWGDLTYKIISPWHEVRFHLDEKFIVMLDSISQKHRIDFMMNILKYLGLGSLSNHHRKQLLEKKWALPPYYIEIENWNKQKYMVFRRGRSSLSEITSKTLYCLKLFYEKESNHAIQQNTYSDNHLMNTNREFVIIPAHEITKRHKIKFPFGHKLVKALLREKSISLRQMHHLKLVTLKSQQNQVVFIPLSVLGLTDIYAENY